MSDTVALQHALAALVEEGRQLQLDAQELSRVIGERRRPEADPGSTGSNPGTVATALQSLYARWTQPVFDRPGPAQVDGSMDRIDALQRRAADARNALEHIRAAASTSGGGAAADDGDLQAVNEALHRSNRELQRQLDERSRGEREAADRLGEEILARRREAAAAMEARREAETARLAKSRFLTSISHDLRQPMQAMLTLTHLLSTRVQDGQTAQLITQLRDAMQATAGLLDALLDISRIDAGLVKPRLESFAVRSVLDRVAAEFKPAAGAKSLRLVEIATDRTVRSDPRLLEAIVRNLTSNAVRYTRQGRILLGCRTVAGRFRLEVWDTGQGIPGDQLDAIFDEFHQVGNPERDRVKGFGIGLALVRRLARLLGHSVGVRSVFGRGSVFWVELPLAAPGTAGAAPRAGAAVDMAGRVVVVVEDDELQLSALCMLLQDWGCRVVAAQCVETAEQTLADAGLQPDVVVSDFRLRDGADGIRAIDRIRRRVRRPLPGLLLTGDTDPERLRETRSANLGLLHKPFSPGELRRSILDVLGKVAQSS